MVKSNLPSVEAGDAVERLVDQARAGDERAFARLYDRYWPRLCTYFSYRLGGRKLDAEDLANDVLLKVAENLHSYKSRGIPFSAWVFRIARNHLIDYIRARSNVRESPLEGAFDRQDGERLAIDHAIVAEDVDAALRQLTPQQQRVIVLRFIFGMSMSETARALRRSEEAVKKVQARAIRSLRALLR